MNFEWDETKSETNYRKHGVRFEEAQTVFLDPKSVEFFDEAHCDKEDRFIRIGTSGKLSVLLVIFCERNNSSIRIISTRRATEKEKETYEKGI